MYRNSRSPDETTVATFNARSQWGSPEEMPHINRKGGTSTSYSHFNMEIRSTKEGDSPALVERGALKKGKKLFHSDLKIYKKKSS